MPESKNIPEIKRLQGGVIIPCNVRQLTRTNEESEQETFYVFQRIKLRQQSLPSLPQAKRHIVECLRNDLHTHVFSYYDLGAQNSINGLAQWANRQGMTEIQNSCEAILDWIDQCLDSYYTAKDAILTAVDEESLVQVSWNFQATNPKPNTLKSLRELRGMF